MKKYILILSLGLCVNCQHTIHHSKLLNPGARVELPEDDLYYYHLLLKSHPELSYKQADSILEDIGQLAAENYYKSGLDHTIGNAELAGRMYDTVFNNYLSNMNIISKVVQITVPARAYQLEIVEDSLLLFDGNRFVGAIPFEDSSAIGSMIIGDNE